MSICWCQVSAWCTRCCHQCYTSLAVPLIGERVCATLWDQFCIVVHVLFSAALGDWPLDQPAMLDRMTLLLLLYQLCFVLSIHVVSVGYLLMHHAIIKTNILLYQALQWCWISNLMEPHSSQSPRIHRAVPLCTLCAAITASSMAVWAMEC